jgi:hypothetical protein
VNHLRWIILVAACFGCVGCERDRDMAADDLRADDPAVTARRDMPQPRTDITDQQRADMPQQRADMPRDQMTDQQRMDQQRMDQQRADLQRPGQPGAQGQAQSAAVQAIARARCEREQRCGRIGADQNYTSTEACLTEIRQDWADELSAYECPGGVEQDELTECVQEIRTEDCAAPFDTLARVVACRSSDICQAG